jgi:hypothetical protein
LEIGASTAHDRGVGLKCRVFLVDVNGELVDAVEDDLGFIVDPP